MKGLNFSNKGAFSSLVCLLITFFLSVQLQDASGADHATVVETLNGKVIIKLEPHGSIRVQVVEGQILQYEFILDRVAQQKLLTKNIDRANIYLIGKHGAELVIDDLKTKKRYVLSMFDGVNKHKNIPPAQNQTITLKGYSVSLVR